MKAKISLYTSLVALLLSAGLMIGCSQLIGRSDAQIATDVQQKLQGDPAVTNKQIQVQSDRGVVALNGSVGSDAERTAAANDAAHISGVKTVVNNLQVTPQQAAQVAPPQAMTPTYAPEPRQRPSAYRSRPSSTRSSSGGSNYGGGQANNDQTAPAQVYSAPAAPPAPPKPVTVTVPPGTELAVRISETLNSNKNHPGDVFHGSLESPVSVDDQIVIPSGAEVTGRVVDTNAANRVVGKPAISLELTQISFNGHFYQVRTDPFHREGSSRGKRTAKTAGGGAAVGAIIGAIAGGGKGAAIGAATGAGAGGTAGAVTGQDDVKLESETVINFQLQSPVTVTPASKASRYASDQQPQ